MEDSAIDYLFKQLGENNFLNFCFVKGTMEEKKELLSNIIKKSLEMEKNKREEYLSKNSNIRYTNISNKHAKNNYKSIINEFESKEVLVTKFAVLKLGVDPNKIYDENNKVLNYINKKLCFDEVFIRDDNSRWLNPLAIHLPSDTKVYPLDNYANGIYTIKDCIKYLKAK